MTEDTKGVSKSTGWENKKEPSLQRLGITMDKRFDLAVSVSVVLIGVLILITARNIRAGSVADPITSHGLPNIMGAFLVIVGIVLSVRQFITWSELPGHLVPEEGQEDERGHAASASRSFGIILLSIIWVWFLKPLGFLIVTPFYLLLSCLLMGVQSRLKMVVFSIILTLIFWVIFGPVLGIRLPLGPLETLARKWGLIL